MHSCATVVTVRISNSWRSEVLGKDSLAVVEPVVVIEKL